MSGARTGHPVARETTDSPPCPDLKEPDLQLYLISPVFFAILALCVLGGMHRLLLLLAVSMPFGMLAIVGLPSVGGLSLLAVNVTAATLVGIGCMKLASRLARGATIYIEPATLALAVFAIYSVFSATVLVRLFAGETMVFSLSRGDTGVKVSTLFSWGKVWLSPSNSNISQTFYVVLAFGFFVVTTQVLARHGTALGARCMAVAATVNLALGLLDLAALDALLSFVRTASYSLSNEASVHGIPRIIGGYSEAASFGAASAMFFAYFASSVTYSGSLRDAVLALGNGIFAALALSSTGIIALGVVLCVLALRTLSNAPATVRPSRLFTFAVLLACAALAMASVMALTTAPEMIASVIADLILDKSQSSSGLERTAWAMGGLEAFRDTWGLGAGTGSLRSNGLLFVLLGSVGIIGTTAFAAFLWYSFGGRALHGQEATLSNARVAALATIVSMLLAATVPDPGIPLILLAAIAVSAKRNQHGLSESTGIAEVAQPTSTAH